MGLLIYYTWPLIVMLIVTSLITQIKRGEFTPGVILLILGSIFFALVYMPISKGNVTISNYGDAANWIGSAFFGAIFMLCAGLFELVKATIKRYWNLRKKIKSIPVELQAGGLDLVQKDYRRGGRVLGFFLPVIRIAGLFFLFLFTLLVSVALKSWMFR